ncbi:MAG: DUF3800 domain-containing protein [Clostridia bacterium]|nr:DUF3800 domain-containing protein [Clostridia bacterium]MBQ8469236.1 DUF3800 domain-containing protein [Clostridia bacterium]
MKELSIFVDESGDFGPYSHHSPYYIISMVFHDQNVDITPNIAHLDYSLEQLGYLRRNVIHTEPLIRREEEYNNLSPNERRQLLSKLFYFSLSCDISYTCFAYSKREYPDLYKLQGRMARDIAGFFKDHMDYFLSFDNVILYYDNGQKEISSILNTVMALSFTEYEVRRVFPIDYKLFQVADLICTLKLLSLKLETNTGLTRSERLVFHSERDLKKDFLKGIRKKEFQ